MMRRLRGKFVALTMLIVFLFYVGYRIYETKSDAAALQVKTHEDAVPTVAIVHPKPADATETITLPGNITAWFEAPIYAQVSGYVKMWYKDYGAQVKRETSSPKSMHRRLMHNMLKPRQISNPSAPSTRSRISRPNAGSRYAPIKRSPSNRSR